ncbi:MAG: hypothetical protein IPO63_11425 [Bacteroidetes bacterium]|nr:hypothetical protein [Bacteroidota bacterium]
MDFGIDYWVVKTDTLGKIQWQNTIGGECMKDYIPLNKQLMEGLCIRWSSNSNISGDKTENSLGSYDFWIVKLTDKYNLITGKLFADLNNNGIQDNGELPLSSKKIVEQNSHRFNYSDQNGNYKLLVIDTGNFTVSPQSVNWFSPVP